MFLDEAKEFVVDVFDIPLFCVYVIGSMLLPKSWTQWGREELVLKKKMRDRERAGEAIAGLCGELCVSSSADQRNLLARIRSIRAITGEIPMYARHQDFPRWTSYWLQIDELIGLQTFNPDLASQLADMLTWPEIWNGGECDGILRALDRMPKKALEHCIAQLHLFAGESWRRYESHIGSDLGITAGRKSGIARRILKKLS